MLKVAGIASIRSPPYGRTDSKDPHGTGSFRDGRGWTVPRRSTRCSPGRRDLSGGERRAAEGRSVTTLTTAASAKCRQCAIQRRGGSLRSKGKVERGGLSRRCSGCSPDIAARAGCRGAEDRPKPHELVARERRCLICKLASMLRNCGSHRLVDRRHQKPPIRVTATVGLCLHPSAVIVGPTSSRRASHTTPRCPTTGSGFAAQ